MMKRTGVPRLGPEEPQPMPPQSVSAQIQQAGASNMHTLAQSAQPQILGATAMLSVGGGFSRGARAGAPAVINYLKAGTVQYAPKQPPVPPRMKQPGVAPLPAGLGRQSPAPAPLPAPAHAHPHPAPHHPHPPPPQHQFQRLKVEDALSYLDQVKYKFNTQPQVYNDFLDIMKEFKSQTIDTPGVITRVSNLFKGHPELIVGFNTFLPPGYKIEVQSNGQVSVSMPSPTGLGGGVLLGVHPQPLVHLLPHQPPPHPPHPPHQHQPPPSVPSAIVHNLSVSAAPANTLHHISQAHQQIEAAAIQHHQPGGGGGAPHAPAAGQPVEFNHAIEYVNKIKSRFSRQPDKYKRFLEILHAYQRGHRDVKEPQQKQQTEQEVYSQVAKLFENQEDLLAEFGQFLPDAKAVTKPAHYPPHDRTPPLLPPPQQRPESEAERFPIAPASPPHQPPPHPMHHHHQVKHTTAVPPAAPQPHLKRSPSFTSTTQMAVGAPPPKKSRLSSLSSASIRDVSYAEAAKLATAQEYNFFDKARKALRSQHVYDNFLRCLLLFTNEIISCSELVAVTAPFLSRHPELHRWLRDFVGAPDEPPAPHPHAGFNSYGNSSTTLLGFERERDRSSSNASVCERDTKMRYEPIGALGAQLRHERPQGDAANDIDLTTCKRLGTSYCALPREAASKRCSGRTALCKEVLNDTWVSFPTWSEDSTFVTSRKTQYEEYIYRCEDERFELDVVIETNAATIRVLEGVQKKLSRMSSEEAAKYRLDDCLGGHSPTIHQRALRRIYGDKAVDIIAGLKKNPVVAVPVVLRRLKAKEEEWREAQKGFNKQWREQNEKYYLKSLDHQGINFKQNDLKAMRSKSLFNEVEAAMAARRAGPHLVVDYTLATRQEAIKIVRDAAELLIHHARRQTAIQKAEKRRIKQLLRQFLPDLFAHPRQPLSDDERDEGSQPAIQKAEKRRIKQLLRQFLPDLFAHPRQPLSDDERDEGSQPAIQKAEKRRIKQLLRQFLPDLSALPRQPLSDDERDEEDKEEPTSPGSPAADPADKDSDKGVKQEKQESSESDNASDKSGKNNKNDKENKPKNNNNTDSKESIIPGANNVKRSSSNESQTVKSEPKPENEGDDLRDHPANEARFVCTSSWYLFLRLHGAVCQRLAAARRAAAQIADQHDRDAARTHPSVAHALRLKPNNLPADASSPCEYYNALLELVKGVLDGNTEAGAYEDACREMLGIRAYPAYTLDKLVSIAVRQLQHCVSEPWSCRATEMAARGGMRGPLSYVRRAHNYLRKDHTAFLVKVYGGDECKVTFELLEGAGEGRTSPQHNNENSRLSPTNQARTTTTNGEAVSIVSAWSLYTERYARPDTRNITPNKPVFLRRNARRDPAYTGGASSNENVATGAGADSAVVHHRRKPQRLADRQQCTIHHHTNTLRLLASLPHQLYRPGCLRTARAAHARLHAAKRAKFRAWLTAHAPHT